MVYFYFFLLHYLSPPEIVIYVHIGILLMRNKILQLVAALMELESIMVRKMSQKKEDKYKLTHSFKKGNEGRK